MDLLKSQNASGIKIFVEQIHASCIQLTVKIWTNSLPPDWPWTTDEETKTNKNDEEISNFA